MKEYDIIVYFDADYLCTGAFYDSFEYFWLLRQKYNVGFVIIVDEGFGTVRKAIDDKYDVNLLDPLNDMYFFTHDMKAPATLSADLLFIPSMASACCMYNNNVDIKHNKVITIMELPPTHGWMKAFDKPRDNVLVLRDDRLFPTAPEGYETQNYHRSIYFDIMFPCENTYKVPTGMLNMVTDHKCYEPDEIRKIIKEPDFHKVGGIERWVLFTKDKHWMKYKDLRDENFDVLLTPDYGYMGKFSHIVYLPSKRDFDPSPRLIAEAKHFEKQFVYYNWKNAPWDGGRVRMMDILNSWDSMKMTLNDPIFDIIEDYK